ncbi:MAG: transcription termination/antitermination protein NusA [Bacteroidales bacterium]|jgi:N utilization substance protein A|nr:transcription termination/antitermination protein NusA [Bacteroidales bacterium]
MEGLNLASTFAEFKDQKNIDRATMMGVLEEVFLSQLKKMYSENSDFDIIINIDKGDLQIFWNREVVEEVTDPMTEISFEDANKIDEYDLGEECSVEIKLADFGRRGILNLRQSLSGRIMDIEKANLYNKYRDKVGDLFVGEVYQVWKREVVLRDDEGNDLILPKEEQIPGDFFRKGDTVRTIIKEVKFNNSNTLVIILSRTSTDFLARLFEQEVAEIFEGLITIKKIVRIPGERAKVAVESYDERIDPVGACVGVRGSRIHSIVRELRNENIDVIPWTNNKSLLITRALSPAKISSMTFNEEAKQVNVYLKPSEVSLAVGKGGSNINLAGELVGYKLEIYRDDDGLELEEDVLLTEFSDEIDMWIIEQLQKIGCDTAKSVLALSVEDIVQRADLEEETAIEVQKILRAEFEE